MSTEKIKGTEMLRDAIADAERLLAYASEYGIELEQKHIKAIITSKKNSQLNQWSEQDEIDFWQAFQYLSKIVSPVTIDSIRASSTTYIIKKNWWSRLFKMENKSLVERSVSYYRRFALIAMLGMLAIQIYALIGTALMAKVNSGNERMMEIEQRMQSLLLITASNTEDNTARMERDNLEAENDELGQEVESGIHLLSDWLNSTYNVWSRGTKAISSSVMENKVGTDGPPAGGIITSENIVVVQQAKSLIIILNQYFLPLLYGLLGGLAFVLRSLANETKSMTYTPTSKIKYGLRIHLGALAGLVIGFLWGDFQDKSFGVVESLSPLAVAFLAGYSVDFLFRMLDSVIGNTGAKALETTGAKSDEKTGKKS